MVDINDNHREQLQKQFTVTVCKIRIFDLWFSQLIKVL